MIPDPDAWSRPSWGRSLLLAGGVHALAIGALFVHITQVAEPDARIPAIAVDMAPPSALPAPVKDVPTPHQVEAPQQVMQDRPAPPKKLLFDPPPLQRVDTRPEVVLPQKKEEPPKPEKANPLPPAPATTQQAAPDLKPDTKTAAMIDNGASPGKASPADLWAARVLSRIQLMKHYPGLAARQNQQDDVNVVLTLNRDGRLLDAKVQTGRGFALLNDAALDAVRHASPFPKPPREITGDPIALSVVINFRMRHN